ncbi:MAG: hypothetical protein U9Q07_06625, partial [Planctomycetota bacterium]|nr:hypothetical protein [Planctomycetota bacterium]
VGFGAGDYAAAEANIAIPFAGGVGAVYTVQIPIMTQAWITTPASNNGLVSVDAVPGAGYIEFDSQESATAAERPQLTVVYTVPSVTPTGLRQRQLTFRVPSPSNRI